MSESSLQTDRLLVIRERDRNVIVEASAGTGKTRLVVERFVELLAPTDGGRPLSVDRIAAVTFTRKAASELRLRIRQEILRELTELSPDSTRAGLLHAALAGVDTAYISTIHGFADRLLRRWPSHARLDPHYELADDGDALVRETYAQLLRGAETGTLAEQLRDPVAAARAAEAGETIAECYDAGVRLYSKDVGHRVSHGLDGFVTALLAQRDAPIHEPPRADLDRATLRRFADEYVRTVEGVSAISTGGSWLLQITEQLRGPLLEAEPAVIFRELVPHLDRGPRGKASDAPRKKYEFGDDPVAWRAWKVFAGDTGVRPARESALRDDLLAPLRRWLAVRVLRLRPVILGLYAQVKAERRAVDHVDLVLQLRDLLRVNLPVRTAAQGLFDHLFVDEFQDTDPLQAEIVLFLAERETVAATWDAVTPAAGTLTLVGDPKQSIYRFRRADITTYQRVLEIVKRAPHVTAQLVRSYRSAPALVDWLNRRLDDVMGAEVTPEGTERGEVPHDRLVAGRPPHAGTPVHVIRLGMAADAPVDAVRTLEAAALARYLRWLVYHGDTTVTDRSTGRARPVTFGDIAVLAVATTNLPLLFDAFDRDAIPFAARGGRLFLDEPLHRQFLLGLCAIADRDDGVAVLALLKPPFFALSLADHARSRRRDPTDRVDQARAIVSELRRRRFERRPGATARALLEDTGLAAAIALGSNGAQRLSRLRELCFQVERCASDEQLDFDATMGRLRRWCLDPIQLDPPHPVASEAVRVLTIHQAKGLEFPAVVLWDCRAAWAEAARGEAFTLGRSGDAWSIRLDGLSWDEPRGNRIAAREKAMRDSERKRLVYVAATRARDVLVMTTAGAVDKRWIWSSLLGATPSNGVVERPYPVEGPTTWFAEAAPPPLVVPATVTTRDAELGEIWRVRATAASEPRLRPTAFTAATSARSWWGRKGRFGTAFGASVHVAIGHVLRDGLPADEAVRRAAVATGLRKHLFDAVADVQRAVDALAALEMTGVQRTWRLEYPISGVGHTGELVAGYVDLVCVTASGVVVIDFKTDPAPESDADIADAYRVQVRGYARMIERMLAPLAAVRTGLLYTADGQVHWINSSEAA